MSTVVITGARGYIARALAKSLASWENILRLVSRAAIGPTRSRTGVTIEHVQADLFDTESWHDCLNGVDAVVHLSSRTDLHAAEADPAGDRRLNVEPVRALVRAAERRGAAVAVFFASSTSIAGHPHANPVNEQTPDNPCSVYDRHKLECEDILRDATRRGVLRACSLRLPTVYGYGDGAAGSANANRGILNVMIRRAIDGQALTVYGDGAPVRDFTYVDDVCNAFQLALVRPGICDGGHFIIGTGRGHTVAEAFGQVAQEAYRVTGRKVEVCHVPEPPDLHSIERSDFIGDASAFQKLTGWRAKFDLQSGIRHCLLKLVGNAQSVDASQSAS